MTDKEEEWRSQVERLKAQVAMLREALIRLSPSSGNAPAPHDLSSDDLVRLACDDIRLLVQGYDDLEGQAAMLREALAQVQQRSIWVDSAGTIRCGDRHCNWFQAPTDLSADAVSRPKMHSAYCSFRYLGKALAATDAEVAAWSRERDR